MSDEAKAAMMRSALRIAKNNYGSNEW